MAYTVSGLTDYVKENESIILKDLVFGNAYGDTIPLMAKQLGVKDKARIHPSTLDVTLQTVTGCSFNADTDLEFSEREIETKQKKVNAEFCEEDLLGKFAEYEVTVGPNEDGLPFEAELIDGMVKSVNKQVETDVWTDIIGICSGAADSASVVSVSAAAGTSAYDYIMKMYMAIPEEVLNDAIIFVSPAIFREYIKDLVEKNFYHYNPADGALSEMFIPGTGVKVRKADGLAGKENAIATSPKNLVYGTDFLGNKEEVKVWFSDDNDTWRVKMRFNYGVQVAFPDLVVYGTRATA